MGEKQVDEITGVETTGHEWDGVTELNNPMPKWWVNLFYACIAFAGVYVIFYPAIPMINDHTRGLLGYSARGEVAERIAAHSEMQSVWKDRIAAASLEEIREDPDLFNFALASGAANFALNCSQCHGSGAAGNVGGFPNLNDDDWLWGGDLESIYTTIAHGVRNEDDPDARFSMMPAYGADGLLSRAEIRDVAQYVMNFSGRATDMEAVERAAETWEYNCAACHGDDGRGDTDLGAPNLTDAIWLYGGSAEEIFNQVWNPRHGVMPPWLERLGDTTVKELAVYVHALGGGE
ncbi:MAG: cytochrome-c oxidase, cbb3-type subunit III [Rhodobacteraceae bacterium]|nr:MAG: cytochrome-c oxidase, cbb3-type subunit III [Paracoccaceae bacterium]